MAKTKQRRPIKLPPKAAKRKPRVVAPVVPSSLNAKQQRFVEEYCVDLNGTQAAIRAGYAKRSATEQAYDLLRHPQVAAAIAQWKARRTAATLMTKEEIALEMQKLAQLNLADYHRIGENGEPIVDLSGCTRAQLAALTELEVHDYVDGRGEDARVVKKVRFKTADKRQSLMDLARLLGMVTDKSEVTGKLEVTTAEKATLMEAFDRLPRQRQLAIKAEYDAAAAALARAQALAEGSHG